MNDLRFAFRQFAKAPGYTAIAIATLALGIGATTALFSVVYGVILAPYPYANAGQIWAGFVEDAKTGHVSPFQAGDFAALAAQPTVAAAMATSPATAALERGAAAPEIINATYLTGAAFQFLGVSPVLGRYFTPADVRPNGDPLPVCVLTFKRWQDLFDGRDDAIGQTVMLDHEPYTVLGVMPPRFGWWNSDGLWRPMPRNDPKRYIAPIFRLAPGVSRFAAEQQLSATVTGLAQAAPERFPAQALRGRYRNYLDITVASGVMRSSLLLLLYAVGFLLLIACANVANLQLARAATRRREIAVRLALGASRGRIVRQLLLENVVLAVGGGLAGIFLAWGLNRAVVALMPPFYVPNEARVTLNVLVLVFSAGLSVLTGVLFGLAPALQFGRSDLNDALKDGGNAAAGGGVRGQRTRHALVVVEVALSLVLLVGATVAIRGFIGLQQVDRGLRPGNAFVVQLPLSPKRYSTFERRNAFARALLEQVRAIPGVAVAATGNLPSAEVGSAFDIAGQPRSPFGLDVNLVDDAYLDALGLPLHGGRNFTAQEVNQGEPVALVNESAAKLWADGRSPVGRTISLDWLAENTEQNLSRAGAAKLVTVIGVVADTRTRPNDLTYPPRPIVFVPYTLVGSVYRSLIVRGAVASASLIPSIREVVHRLDPDQPMPAPQPIEQLLARQFIQPRFTLALFSGLAAIALALATAGIYGVLSYTVAQRTREIGVRMALGAGRSQILRLIVGRGGRLVLMGLAVGAAASLALTTLVRTQIFAVPSIGLLELAIAAGVLACVGFLACAIPARRATRIEPVVALRSE